MNDFDPGGPLLEDFSGTPDQREAAIRQVNYGDTDPASLVRYKEAKPHEGPPPVMPLNIIAAHAFLTACMTSNPRVKYGLGAKVPFFRAKPGIDFVKVDCSGFVREAVREATIPMTPFPDGSVVQHDWIMTQSYRKSTVDAAKAHDGKVRIAFLKPQDTSSGIGHVVLVHNAMTLESHGGVGPNGRPWTGSGWQSKAHVYELTSGESLPIG